MTKRIIRTGKKKNGAHRSKPIKNNRPKPKENRESKNKKWIYLNQNAWCVHQECIINVKKGAIETMNANVIHIKNTGNSKELIVFYVEKENLNAIVEDNKDHGKKINCLDSKRY